NDSSEFEPMAILAERLVVEVVFDLPLEEVRLADEEVGAACGLDQALSPFRVAGVGDHLPAVLDAQGIGGRTARVLDDERGHAGGADQGQLPLSKFDKLGGEAAVTLDESGKKTSIAASTRSRTPGGPPTTSGRVRRLNWPSR